jgi:type IV secretion system protein VirB4
VDNKNPEIGKSFNYKIADLIPIVSHYDAKTLVTKNADLVQIIEIQGFLQKEYAENGKILRDEVRKAIMTYVHSPDIAIYLHVVRDYKNIMPKMYEGPEPIVRTVEKTWCKKHRWDRQLVNTLYITIVKQGPKIGFFNIADFLRSVTPFVLEQKYKKHFHESAEVLSTITENIRNHLSIFFSKILSIHEEEGKFYSEPLSFYHYLTHLKRETIELKKYDFAELLSDFDMKVDFNVLSIKHNGINKSGAIYTMSLANEVSPEFLDSILQCKSQFILSELLTFVSPKKAVAKIVKYRDTLKSVKNIEMAKDLCIEQALDADQGSANDYCSSQITMILYADDHNDLQKKVENISMQFNKLGLKVVREDFNLQTAFFNNLPGNTFYSNRSDYLPTIFSAAFAEIHSQKMGNYNGSKWGDPVTILETLKSDYYNFNFHCADNGNTIIVGPKGSGKTTLAHFLLAQSLKFDINIIYIDLEGRSDKFIGAINGKSITLIEDQVSPIQIDLLNLNTYGGQVDSMADLLLRVCTKNDQYRYKNQDYIAQFRELANAISKMQTNTEKIKHINAFMEQLNDLTIKTNYQNFFKSDFFNNFFQKDAVDILRGNKYLSIDFSKITEQKQLFNVFLGLFLAKIPDFLTGQKTIVVINHAHNIFDSYTFENQIAPWLNKLTENNAMILLSQENTGDARIYSNIARVIPYFASKIYLSDRMIDKDFKHTFGLSNQEFNYIKGYDQKRRQFLIKHGKDSVFVKMDLDDLKEVLEYLG